MKLVVQGIEEIELTDPQGLCNPLSPRLPSLPTGIPSLPVGIHPTPQIPTPLPGEAGGWGDPTIRPIPGTGDVAVPHSPSIYTRHVLDPNDPFTRVKWGIGDPMIQQAGDPKDADKWGKNWQSKMNGAEGQEDGNGNNH